MLIPTLAKVGKCLLVALYAPALYSIYLAGYGPFELSALGVVASLPAVFLLYRWDAKVKFLTHDRRGKHLVVLAAISFCGYGTLSGYVLTRGIHELIATPSLQAVDVSPSRLPGRRSLCRYRVYVYLSTSRTYCANKEEYEQFKIEPGIWQRTAWAAIKNSPLGSTISFISPR